MTEPDFAMEIAPPPVVPIIWGSPYQRLVKVAEIVEACAAVAEVSVKEMLSPRRAQDVVRPRQVAMYLAAEHTGLSLPDIGRRCGGRNHSTVVHARKRVSDDLEWRNGDEFGAIVDAVERRLGLR